MAKILFVHNGVPGRFTPIAEPLVARGHQCALINGPGGNPIPGVPVKVWKGLAKDTPNIFEPARQIELDMRRGQVAAREALAFAAEGFQPDLIIGHPAWGEMVFLREIFPDAPQIQIGEFYYHSRNSDVDFDPEFRLEKPEPHLLYAKNAGMTLSFAEADCIVCPTAYQASTLPSTFEPRIRVIHEGIDTKAARRIPNATGQLQGGKQMKAGDPIVTFINRRFEPMRGFHTFMRALPPFQKENPKAHALIVGADDPNIYGMRAPKGQTWKKIMMAELKDQLDLSRIHFLGTVNYQQLITVLSLSSAHVYYTYPFVLSWSLLDAMATECLLVGSDTAPVREVLKHGENGLLVDFFDHEALARTLTSACQEPKTYAHLRAAARQTVVSDYDRDSVCIPQWMALVDEVLARKRPA
jgi:glycosyltransferase involved in cell wall biosynthesis